jgi:hypothetical protein
MKPTGPQDQEVVRMTLWKKALLGALALMTMGGTGSAAQAARNTRAATDRSRPAVMRTVAEDRSGPQAQGRDERAGHEANEADHGREAEPENEAEERNENEAAEEHENEAGEDSANRGPGENAVSSERSGRDGQGDGPGHDRGDDHGGNH